MEKTVILAYVDPIILLLPALSFMLYDFFQEGMIFEFYGKWLDRLPINLAKPLGLCLKCFHIWVVIIFAVLFLDVSILKFIISTSISYVILVKLFF
jgi:hypothetical protein